MLRDKRSIFRPVEYPQAEVFWKKQQQAHWLHLEVSMASDIHDWNSKLTPSEKNVVGNILKGFTQVELVVGEYWSTNVSRWFPKPEIALMTAAFSSTESIHTYAYAYLNESLGLDDFTAFLEEPTARDKINSLVNQRGKSIEEIAISLATFSAFAEGVQLFSSFAVLMNFSRFNKLKGLGQIVAWSSKDESLHSEAGCWLFRQLIHEYPEIWTKELKSQIYDAARAAIKLEDDFIEKAFELGDIEGLSKHELKSFIRFRANTKLGDLGLGSNWKNINQSHLDSMSWFDYLITGVEHQDFFAGRSSAYSVGVVDFSNIFDSEVRT